MGNSNGAQSKTIAAKPQLNARRLCSIVAFITKIGTDIFIQNERRRVWPSSPVNEPNVIMAWPSFVARTTSSAASCASISER